MIRCIVPILATLLIAGCSVNTDRTLKRNDAAQAAVMLKGVKNVKLHGPRFKCARQGPPALYSGVWSNARVGLFFTGQRAGAEVRGAVCVKRGPNTVGPADVIFLS